MFRFLHTDFRIEQAAEDIQQWVVHQLMEWRGANSSLP